MKSLRIIFFALLMLQYSCNNELKLNAPYEEMPSIYAVFNPQEKVQVVRVNKVFLGEGDANKMAKVADSVNYPAGEITVTLERFIKGVQVPAQDTNIINPPMVITFKEEMVTANPGSFSTSQRVYTSDKKLFTTGDYKLNVKNNRTKNVFTATAHPVAPITAGFRPLLPPYYPYNPNTHPDEYIDYSVPNPKIPYEVRHSPSDAFAYQLDILIHIEEKVSFSSTYNWKVPYTVGVRNLREVQKISGNSFLSHSFTGAGIFAAVGNAASKMNQTIIGRKVYAIEYVVYATTQEYMDYIEYVKPSLSISQSKPLYSNFDNQAALGLFTFRSTFSVLKQPKTFYVNAFSTDPSTCSYKFQDSNNNWSGCK